MALGEGIKKYLSGWFMHEITESRMAELTGKPVKAEDTGILVIDGIKYIRGSYGALYEMKQDGSLKPTKGQDVCYLQD